MKGKFFESTKWKFFVSIFPVAFFSAVLMAIPWARMASNREFRPAQMVNIDSALTLVGLLGMFIVFALVTFYRRVSALESVPPRINIAASCVPIRRD